MAQLVNSLQWTSLPLNCTPFVHSLCLVKPPPISCSHHHIHNTTKLHQQRFKRLQSSLQESRETVDSTHTRSTSTSSKANSNDEEAENAIPHVQTLSRFPKEELHGKVAMVRFDSTFMLWEVLDTQSPSVQRSFLTIEYLHNAGAKVIIATNWDRSTEESQHLSTETLADYLSSVLQLKVVAANWISCCAQSKMDVIQKEDILLIENLSVFREEVANCPVFSRNLSSGVDIFVNDAFTQSHRIFASTVGVSRYCYASIAGFLFEEELSRLVELTAITKQPYVAIIGGGNLHDKAAALHLLACKCDGMVFVGMMAFQIMHALRLPVPLGFLECDAIEDSLKIIQLAHERNIPILLPADFWCVNDTIPEELRLFPADGILDGWLPVDLGPVTINAISSLLLKGKKILWIGPVKIRLSRAHTQGTSNLARLVGTLSQSGCDVTVVGRATCKAFARTLRSSSVNRFYENASVVWEFLKGRMLPGLAALDRAYPFVVNWNTMYYNPSQPLAVDVGSGNGLFLFGMARKQKDVNFLGLEINKKLVRRCLNSVHQSGLNNGYFIATNATSTFRSIVSSYQGELTLVSIQCPNPDFNKQEHRWRMLQRSLIEAIVDLLALGGKVFLQSDVEEVALRMQDLFMTYGKGRLGILNYNGDLITDNGGWLKENPYGVRSDWERHVLDRGAPMYRLMLSKVDRCKDIVS